MADNNQLALVITDVFEQWADEDTAIEVISLSTSDGFPIHSCLRTKTCFDSDTMAAAASTLHSVSKAVAQQILAKEFKSTFIESKQGNVCFVAFKIDDKEYVLAMSADQSMNIANLRISINRLAEEIIGLG